MSTLARQQQLAELIWRWVDEVVIGLSLCPFAAAPRRRDQIRLVILDTRLPAEVLDTLVDEMTRLDQTAAAELDTTLIAVPAMWSDFAAFNDFLGEVDVLIRRCDRDGIYQVASFHPGYQFAGTQPHDAENLTNRTPVPILQLLREDSVSVALARYPDPEQIPQRNIKRMSELTAEERRRLFPWT